MLAFGGEFITIPSAVQDPTRQDFPMDQYLFNCHCQPIDVSLNLPNPVLYGAQADSKSTRMLFGRFIACAFIGDSDVMAQKAHRIGLLVNVGSSPVPLAIAS